MDRPLRLVRGAAFCSAFDRMAIAPMLVAIGDDLGVSLAAVAFTATLYFLLYGVMQPLWGMLSDRLGRVAVIRLTLAGAGVASLASALAPSLDVLLVARACAGALFAGVIPTTLVYVGDTVPIERRQIALTRLMGATSAGLAVSTAVAGAAVALVDWRPVFALSAVIAIPLGILLGLSEVSYRASRTVVELVRTMPARLTISSTATRITTPVIPSSTARPRTLRAPRARAAARPDPGAGASRFVSATVM